MSSCARCAIWWPGWWAANFGIISFLPIWLSRSADFDDAEKRYLALALADAYFFKRIPLDQLQTVLHEKLGDAKMAKAQPFLDKAGKTDEYIPPEIPKTSNKYLSLRYNTPEWVSRSGSIMAMGRPTRF
jgi:hypothetical protein